MRLEVYRRRYFAPGPRGDNCAWGFKLIPQARLEQQAHAPQAQGALSCTSPDSGQYRHTGSWTCSCRGRRGEVHECHGALPMNHNDRQDGSCHYTVLFFVFNCEATQVTKFTTATRKELTPQDPRMAPCFLRAHQRASGASSRKRATTPASAKAAPSQRAAVERRCARSEQCSRACLLSAARPGAHLLKGPSSTERLFPRSN